MWQARDTLLNNPIIHCEAPLCLPLQTDLTESWEMCPLRLYPPSRYLHSHHWVVTTEVSFELRVHVRLALLGNKNICFFYLTFWSILLNHPLICTPHRTGGSYFLFPARGAARKEEGELQGSLHTSCQRGVGGGLGK